MQNLTLSLFSTIYIELHDVFNIILHFWPAGCQRVDAATAGHYVTISNIRYGREEEEEEEETVLLLRRTDTDHVLKPQTKKNINKLMLRPVLFLF